MTAEQYQMLVALLQRLNTVAVVFAPLSQLSGPERAWLAALEPENRKDAAPAAGATQRDEG